MRNHFVVVVLVSVLASVGCQYEASSKVVDKSQPPDPSLSIPAPSSSSGANGWAPDKPIPLAQINPDHQHVMHVDWVQLSSVAELADSSEVIARGHIVHREFGALRAYAQAKDGLSAPLGPDGKPPSTDLPITVAKLQIDEVLQVQGDLKTSTGLVGGSLDLLFPGGLMEDGCISEPEDSPLPVQGEEGLFFLKSVTGGVTPVGAVSSAGAVRDHGRLSGAHEDRARPRPSALDAGPARRPPRRLPLLWAPGRRAPVSPPDPLILVRLCGILPSPSLLRAPVRFLAPRSVRTRNRASAAASGTGWSAAGRATCRGRSSRRRRRRRRWSPRCPRRR